MILRVVIDTNVLISSVFGGNPRKVIDLWKNGKLLLIVSDEIVDEYLEVLKRFEFSNDIYVEFIDLLSNIDTTQRISPLKRFKVIKEDPDDDKFLECAVEGGISYIISGDKHLMKLVEFQGVEILSPAKFLKELNLT